MYTCNFIKLNYFQVTRNMLLSMLSSHTHTSIADGISLTDTAFATVMGLDVRAIGFTQRANVPLVTLDKLFERWLSLEAEVINYGPTKYSRPELKGSRPICKINQITSNKGWMSGGFTRSSGNRFLRSRT